MNTITAQDRLLRLRTLRLERANDLRHIRRRIDELSECTDTDRNLLRQWRAERDRLHTALRHIDNAIAEASAEAPQQG